MTIQQAPKAPTLPLPPAEYSPQSGNALVSTLRMYFNQLDAFNAAQSAASNTIQQAPKAPTLPLPPAEYSPQSGNALVSTLRMYFNQLDAFNAFK